MGLGPFHIDLHGVEKFDGAQQIEGSDYWLDSLTNAVAIDATFRNNRLGNVQIRLLSSDPKNATMMEEGVWARVFYRGKLEMSGKVRVRQGSFVDSDDRVYQIRDDNAAPADLIARINYNPTGSPFGTIATDANPTAAGQWAGTPAVAGRVDDVSGYWDWTAPPIFDNAEHTEAEYYGLPSTYETAIRKLWYTAAHQASMYWVFGGYDYSWNDDVPPPNTQLGGPISSLLQLPTVRFQPVSEILQQLTDASGLSVSLVRGGPVPGYRGWDGLPEDTPELRSPGMRLVVREPQVWPADLTQESGIIVPPSSWTLNEAKATRMIVGGPGELAARMVYAYTEPATTSTQGYLSDYELANGWISEVFRDATSAQLNWPEGLDDLDKVAAYYMSRPDVSAEDKATFFQFIRKAALTGMAEGAPTTSLSLTLAETEGFHYGGADGIQLGDIVTARKGDPARGGIRISDRLSEVSISWTKDGTRVTPKVGEVREDPNRQIYDAIARLGRAQRKLSTDK